MLPAAIWAGTATRISRSTPLSDVKVDDPVKVMTRKLEIAGTMSAHAAACSGVGGRSLPFPSFQKKYISHRRRHHDPLDVENQGFVKSPFASRSQRHQSFTRSRLPGQCNQLNIRVHERMEGK